MNIKKDANFIEVDLYAGSWWRRGSQPGYIQARKYGAQGERSLLGKSFATPPLKNVLNIV